MDTRHIALEDCHFYHSIDLPLTGSHEGGWDLRGRFADYTGHVDLNGKTVLDVGTSTGFITFEAEAAGATVTSFEIEDAEQLRELPIRAAAHIVDPDGWLAEKRTYIERMKNSYWLAHNELGSSASCVYGNVYDLAGIGMFDVVLVGQILIHLADGIRALTSIASTCRETLVITEGIYDSDDPIAALSGRADTPEIAYAWYQYSRGWYREVLTMLGFSTITIGTDTFRCSHDLHESEIELGVIVATRA